MEVELFEFGNNPPRLKIGARVQNVDGKTIILANISGGVSEIDFPEISQSPRREYGLWEIGAFELFVSGEGASYTEYNFGFNRNYEMFVFSDYRKLKGPVEILNPPRITCEIKNGVFTQLVELPEDIVSGNPFSITAAVKMKDGSVLYFANRHCGGKADFHIESARDLRLLAE